MSKSCLSIVLLLCTLIAATNAKQWVEMETGATLANTELANGWESLENEWPVDKSEKVSVLLALKQQNLDELYAQLEQAGDPKSASYGQWKALADIEQLVAPSAETLRVVFEQWLPTNDHRVVIDQLTPDWARVTAPAETLSALLGDVHFAHFRHRASGTVITRSTNGYRLPADVAVHLDFVGGLVRFPNADRLVDKTKEASAAPFSFKTTPAAIQQHYNVTVPAKNPNNLQAVASFLGQYFRPEDLATFQRKNNQTQTPIAQIFGTNIASQPGTEASLDVQFLMGVSDSLITTWVYSTNGTTPSGNEPFLDWLLFLEQQSQTTKLPYVFSISYQDYENTVGIEYATRVCTEFAKLTFAASTFHTGSGDWGVGCKDLGNGASSYSCTYFNADFPSSCPYVVSMGSTTFTESRTGGVTEIGVGFSSGGFSNFFSQPSYQQKAVTNYLQTANLPPQSFWNITGRAFPDLAIIGEQFQVVEFGVIMPVAGTSASTPTFASFVSMINSQRLAAGQPTMGYVQPFLYQAWATAASAFSDITTNDQQDSGCCPDSFGCTVGFDAMTGLGVPDFGILSELANSPSFIPALARSNE